MLAQRESINQFDIIEFLKHLQRSIGTRLLGVWDGAPIHRGAELRKYLCTLTRHQVILEQLPGYAPELNPAEGLWNLLKRRELKNVCCDCIATVYAEFRYAKERLRKKPLLLQACLQQVGYL